MSPEYRCSKGDIPLYMMFFKVFQQVRGVFLSGSALVSPVMVTTSDQLVPVTVGAHNDTFSKHEMNVDWFLHKNRCNFPSL